jgi:hypothetical protein
MTVVFVIWKLQRFFLAVVVQAQLALRVVQLVQQEQLVVQVRKAFKAIRLR